MFCFQCQETIGNKGCQYAKGFCGKPAEVANLQDLLIHTLKGISLVAGKKGKVDDKTGNFIGKMLFVTITNVNFNADDMVAKIEAAVAYRDELKKGMDTAGMHDSVNWDAESVDELHRKAETVGVLSTGEDDVRSLRNLLIIGLKGIAAYYEHANVLGYYQDSINEFLAEALASTTKDLTVPEMIGMVMKAGGVAVDTMALLDKANTTTYGNPEITKVNIGVRNNPGILISGHDLKDMDELLRQTEGTGVDVYTHGEMLPANYYPAFKKYKHFVGNYGNSWWLQDKEFETFNGPVLMTTNCLTPPKDSYKDRVFTTSVVSFPGLKHIPDRPEGGEKDFSEIIAMAKTCKPPVEIETGSITGGFAHAQVTALADKVVEAVKSGAIKRFIVMGGCDGRHKERSYFTDVAQELPKDTVILTAGCAKYRYNKLDLGDIGGIPRVLDAGQCNDSYSLAVIALKLKEIFGAESINDLPISFDIAWYEQKAVAVLLALLALGVKGIRLGPTLPAFLSPAVIKVLVEKFDIKPIGEVKADVEAMMAGK
ncbi:MAG: hydroxylamine reductase [Candidatus Delongbacteria bacterium]|nr:hydroxylamine reductase [Candidatus Delongbacteria bacterium]